MRIGLIAPLWEAVPPRTYGGTELVVHLLACELTRLSHDVTVFASGDSACGKESGAYLKAYSEKPLRESGLDHQQAVFYELAMLEDIFAQADRFDILHNHLGYPALSFARLVQTPMLTTLHGAFQPPALKRFFAQHADLPYVSISNYQRRGCPQLNYIATIYHGLPLRDYEPDLLTEGKGYLAFLGRLSPEKGTHYAIQAARATDWPLILAGKVDPSEVDYFEEIIRPEIDHDQIRYIGEVNHTQKIRLLRGARATLCPVTWPEPFGLVLIESMACGTPVLAFRDGSIPEVVSHGETGWIASSLDEMIMQIGRIDELDRKACRKRVETYFSVERMAAEYVAVYESLLNKDDSSMGFQPYRTTADMTSDERSKEPLTSYP